MRSASGYIMGRVRNVADGFQRFYIRIRLVKLYDYGQLIYCPSFFGYLLYNLFHRIQGQIYKPIFLLIVSH